MYFREPRIDVVGLHPGTFSCGSAYTINVKLNTRLRRKTRKNIPAFTSTSESRSMAVPYNPKKRQHISQNNTL